MYRVVNFATMYIRVELDLSKRSFVMAIDGETAALHANIGDFQYSSIVIVSNHEVKIILL